MKIFHNGVQYLVQALQWQPLKHTVGEQAVHILLQCFIIYLSKLIVVIYFFKSIFRNPSLESYYI